MPRHRENIPLLFNRQAEISVQMENVLQERGHTFVAMVRGYRVKAMLLYLGYNAIAMITLKKNMKMAQAMEKC